MTLIKQYLTSRLQSTRLQQTFRELSLSNPNAIDFCSNDYLGFVTRDLLRDPNAGIMKTGATGSRLISGNTEMLHTLEKELAEFHQAEAALVFNSGYSANLGVCSAIADRYSVMLYDECCHASFIDGMKLSQAMHKFKFKHNHVGHLEELCRRYEGRPICIIVESIYSMEGDMAPLEPIVKLARKYKAVLIVDEAHATGVVGPKGKGLVQSLGLQGEVDIRMHTFGKALGSHGAVVVGSQLLRDYLINFSRPFIYTTALPPQNIADIRRAYEILQSPGFSNVPLNKLITYFRTCIACCGFEYKWVDSVLPIQALRLDNVEHTKALAQRLKQEGVFVHPILSPTVRKGTERVRICLHSFNTTEQIDLLFKTIKSFACQLS